MIEMAEGNRDEEIERIEAGMKDQVDEEQEDQDEEAAGEGENEWEKLQNASNEEYLMKTVLPVLY